MDSLQCRPDRPITSQPQKDNIRPYPGDSTWPWRRGEKPEHANCGPEGLACATNARPTYGPFCGLENLTGYPCFLGDLLSRSERVNRRGAGHLRCIMVTRD